MKGFVNIDFNPAKCRQELKGFRRLLQSSQHLTEREIQAFFRKRHQLSAFLGTYAPDIGPANQLGFEFPIFGDFTADIVLGNRERGEYCLIELEDGQLSSLFTTV